MIAIGCDHGALELKEQLIDHLKKRGIECKDYGTYTKDSCDYPVYAKKVAQHRLLRNITMPMYCVWVQGLSDQSLLSE